MNLINTDFLFNRINSFPINSITNNLNNIIDSIHIDDFKNVCIYANCSSLSHRLNEQKNTHVLIAISRKTLSWHRVLLNRSINIIIVKLFFVRAQLYCFKMRDVIYAIKLSPWRCASIHAFKKIFIEKIKYTDAN